MRLRIALAAAVVGLAIASLAILYVVEQPSEPAASEVDKPVKFLPPEGRAREVADKDAGGATSQEHGGTGAANRASPRSTTFSGEVVLRRGNELAPAAGASIRWLATESRREPETEGLSLWSESRTDAHGGFSITVPGGHEWIHYLVTHPEGVRHVGRARLPVTSEQIVLDSGTHVLVRVWGHDGAYRVLLQPSEGAGPTHPRRLTFESEDRELICRGVPLSWGLAVVDLHTDSGGRFRSEPVPLQRHRAALVEFDLSTRGGAACPVS